MTWRTGFAAVSLAAVLAATSSCRARGSFDVGFRFEDFPFTFSEAVTSALGGPLTAAEVDAIKRISRDELTRAFSGLKVTFSDSRDAFWAIRVQLALERRR